MPKPTEEELGVKRVKPTKPDAKPFSGGTPPPPPPNPAPPPPREPDPGG